MEEVNTVRHGAERRSEGTMNTWRDGAKSGELDSQTWKLAEGGRGERGTEGWCIRRLWGDAKPEGQEQRVSQV